MNLTAERSTPWGYRCVMVVSLPSRRLVPRHPTWVYPRGVYSTRTLRLRGPPHARPLTVDHARLHRDKGSAAHPSAPYRRPGPRGRGHGRRRALLHRRPDPDLGDSSRARQGRPGPARRPRASLRHGRRRRRARRQDRRAHGLRRPAHAPRLAATTRYSPPRMSSRLAEKERRRARRKARDEELDRDRRQRVALAAGVCGGWPIGAGAPRDRARMAREEFSNAYAAAASLTGVSGMAPTTAPMPSAPAWRAMSFMRDGPSPCASSRSAT